MTYCIISLYQLEFTNKQSIKKGSFIPPARYNFLWNIVLYDFGGLPCFMKPIYKYLVENKINSAGQTFYKP